MNEVSFFEETVGKSKKKAELSKNRSVAAQELIYRAGAGAGPHQTRELDLKKGSSRKNKHKKPLKSEQEEES